MTLDQARLVALAVIAILLLINLAMLAVGLRMRRRTRSRPRVAADATEPVGPATSGSRSASDRGTRPDLPTAAAIEAFVTSVSGDAMGADAPPIVSDAPTPARAHTSPRTLIDAAIWHRAIGDESARAERYDRPVTVVVGEVRDLGRLVDRLGPEIAERVVAETGHILVAGGRAVDQVARLDDATFGVLMPDTDEPSARHYVDRVQDATDTWFATSGLSVRLTIGSAAREPGSDLGVTVALARQRLREGRVATSPDDVSDAATESDEGATADRRRARRRPRA